jgi:2',3'-cyclic-nucleotide 2'-phosphodiesterase
MKIGFIGDIVGRPGRESIKQHLQKIRQEHQLDYVIANAENASHGFGLTIKNANELLTYGIDLMSGGNHSFDKKEIIPLLDSLPILRPDNYPSSVKGSGLKVAEIANQKVAFINLLGEFSMPNVDNPYHKLLERIEQLEAEGVKTIIVDFHAEATAEKRVMFELTKGRVSAILGTHTHIGTDDLMIENNTIYVSDVGMCGCRSGVIGMDAKAPIESALSAIKQRFDIPNECATIFQMLVMEFESGEAVDSYKIKVYDKNAPHVSMRAFIEN